MDELDRVLDIALTGPEAAQAIQAMQEQMRQWGLTLPDTEPFVCDFGLGRFADIGEIEVWIANESEAGYCGKFLFVQDAQTCPPHGHRTKHETFYIVKGTVEMVTDERIRPMTQGEVLAVAPGIRHSFTGVGPALLLEVSMPCVLADNYFSDPDIPIGGDRHTGKDNP